MAIAPIQCEPRFASGENENECDLKTIAHDVITNPISDLRFLSNPLRLGWQRGFLPYQDRLDIRDLLLVPDREIEDLIVRSRSFRQTVLPENWKDTDLTPEKLEEIYNQALRHLYPKGTTTRLLPHPDNTTIARTLRYTLDAIYVDFSEGRLSFYREAQEKKCFNKLVAAVLNHELTHARQAHGARGSKFYHFIRKLIPEMNSGMSVSESVTTCFQDNELHQLFFNNIDTILDTLRKNPEISGNTNDLRFKNYLTELMIEAWTQENLPRQLSPIQLQTFKYWLNNDQLDIEREAHRVGILTCPALGKLDEKGERLNYNVDYKSFNESEGFISKHYDDYILAPPETKSRKVRRIVSELETNHRNVRGFGLLVDSAANLMFGLDWVNYFSERNNSECPDYNKNFDLGIALLSTATTGAWGASIFGKTQKLKALGGRISGSLGALTGLVASFKDFIVDLNDDETTATKTALNALDIAANALILGGSLYFGIEGGTMGRLAPLAFTLTGTSLDIGAKIAKSFC